VLLILVHTGPLIDQPPEDVLKVFDTNTFAALRMAKTVMPLMAKRRSGVIVNIGSLVGEMSVVLSPALICYHNLGLQCHPLERTLLRFKGCLAKHK